MISVDCPAITLITTSKNGNYGNEDRGDNNGAMPAKTHSIIFKD
jgi:hypothetical protein